MRNRDEIRVPRPFETHGKAAWWAVTRVGAVALCILAVGAIRRADEGFDWAAVGFFVGFVLIGWLVVSALVYLYYALAGGVMSREERQRKNLPG